MKRYPKKLLALLLVMFQLVSIIPTNALAVPVNSITVSVQMPSPGGITSLQRDYFVVVGTPEAGFTARRIDKNNSQTLQTVSFNSAIDPYIILKAAYSEGHAVQQYADGNVDIFQANPGEVAAQGVVEDKFDAILSSENSETRLVLFKPISGKNYAVRVRFDPDAVSSVSTGDQYYVFVEVTRAGQTSPDRYWLEKIAADPGSLPVDQSGYPYYDINIPNWKDNNGNNTTDSFTSREENIHVSVVKYTDANGQLSINNTIQHTNSAALGSGMTAKVYSVAYDTKEISPQNTDSQYHEYTNESTNEKLYYDVINLTTIKSANEYTYHSILGPAISFGIVAEHLYHENHLQTNFAVNHYTGKGIDTRPDLSGNSAGAIVIAEFNENDHEKAKDRKSTRLNSSHIATSRMPSSA